LAICVPLAAILLLHMSGESRCDAACIRDRLRDAGGLSGFLFVAAFACVQPLGLPGHLFVIGASLVWSPVPAVGLSLLGAVLGQLLYFLLYRYVAHDWAQARLPPWLRRFEQSLSDKPLRNIVLLRILMFTSPLSPAILGVSRVRALPMLVATVVGLLPTILLDVWLGASLVRWLGLGK
jgi:uncharacterized membrane protein YdjX (TVP38/TMEM64 family)